MIRKTALALAAVAALGAAALTATPAAAKGGEATGGKGLSLLAQQFRACNHASAPAFRGRQQPDP